MPIFRQYSMVNDELQLRSRCLDVGMSWSYSAYTTMAYRRKTRRRRKRQEIELNIYLRKKLEETPWRTACLNKHGNKCMVTGRYLKGKIHVHHITPHAKIRDTVLCALGLRLAYKLSDYTVEQLQQIVVRYLEIHLTVDGVPLLKKVHKLFHKLYGYNTTKEDFVEFKERCDSGEFKL